MALFSVSPVERLGVNMFTAIHTCASASRRGVFAARRKRRPQQPLGCTLHELRELSEETGFSVDDVISRLDDFLSADALLGAGKPLLEALEERVQIETREDASLAGGGIETAEEFLRVEAPEIVPQQETPEAQIEEDPLQAEPIQEPIIQEEPIALFPEEELPPAVARPESPAPEPEREPWELLPRNPQDQSEQIDLDFDGVTLNELRETTTVYVEEAVTVRAVTARAVKKYQEEMEKKAEAEKLQEAEMLEAEATEIAAPSEPKEIPQIARSSAIRFFRKAEPEIVVENDAAAAPKPFAKDEPKAAPKSFAQQAPEAEPEIVVESAAEVVEAETVENPPERIVWPWEIRDCLTLQEALETLDDKALTALTEEIVECTTSGSLGDGAIKSLCRTYHQDMQKVYTAIQKESRHRITRMNRKKPASPMGMDSTQEMAMRMAKQFLGSEMCKRAMRFVSPWPDADGNYYIIQSHRVDDEDSLDFPNERTYYQEMGDGWAISVGY